LINNIGTFKRDRAVRDPTQKAEVTDILIMQAKDSKHIVWTRTNLLQNMI